MYLVIYDITFNIIFILSFFKDSLLIMVELNFLKKYFQSSDLFIYKIVYNRFCLFCIYRKLVLFYLLFIIFI